MLQHPVFTKLSALGLNGLSRAVSEQVETGVADELDFLDRLGLAVDREATDRENRAMTRRLQQAKLKIQAAIEDVDFRPARGLDRSTLLDLAQCNWIRKRKNVLVVGPTGAGKSYVACALAHKACREGYSARYYGIGTLTQALEIARVDGSYPNLITRLGRYDLLVLDDFGLAPLTGRQKHDLWQILEDRYDTRSTIVASQFPVPEWHKLIDEPTLADAILDRIIHNSHRITLKGDSMRKIRAAKHNEEKS